MTTGAREDRSGAPRLTDGQAELALGVRRRRWVLGVLGFMMITALVVSGLIAFRMAPRLERAADDQAGRFAASRSVSTLVDETARAQTAAVLSGSAGDLDRASDLSAQLAPSLAALTDGGGGALQAAANELATAAGDLDAAATAAARLLASGDAEGAARTMASDGVSAMAALDAAAIRLEASLDADASSETRRAADIMRWIALTLAVPVLPTAWVFAQLVVGVRQIRRIGAQMHDVSREVSSSAAQLSAASEELAASSVEGAAAFTEALATIEELARAADSIAESVDGVADQSQDMRANIDAAGRDIEESSARLLTLADRVNEIGEILGLINEIADQTNLLALNAAIEAARAGESGKGFTVVAEEVRRLAERSKSSSAQIAEIIDGAQSETSATVLAMEKGAKQMQHAMAFMDTVADASAAGRMSAEQQRSATQQVVITFEQLSGNTKAVSATTHQIAASAVGLADLAKELEDTAANSAAGV